MSQLDEFNQNNLLFKRFQGVVQTNIVNPNTYDGEFGKEALVNTYNDTIFSSNVTKDLSSNNTLSNLALQLPGAPFVSDTSANSWDTGIYGEYSDLKTSQNESVTNLKFYQKVFLKSISSGPYAWWLVDPSNADLSTTNNLLKDMIPFSYGTTGATYSPVVWYYSGPIPTSAVDAENKANDPNNWTPDFNQNSTPLYWLVDYASGVLQFYAEADLNGHIPTTGGNKIKPTSNPANWIGGKPDPTSVPRISFIKYVGEKGAAGGGGGGDASGNLDLSGNLSVGGDADISGNLTVVGDASFCNVLVNCDLDVSGNIDMSGNLNVVGDASFCNVLVNCDLDVSGNTDISGNLTVDGNISVVGDADFCNVLVRCDLDVSGNTDLSQNLLQATASTDLTPSGLTDYNAYFRQSNMIDSMKLPFSTYFDGFWEQMVQRSRGWIKGSTSPFGPNLIPIAKININSSYNSNFPAAGDIPLRSLLANTIGYFTLKFSQPSMDVWEDNPQPRGFSQNGIWKDVLDRKSGYNCIPEQTIHFIAGYQEKEYDDGGETRNPKPFIKVISSSIGDIRNLNGSVVEFANEQVIRIGGLYSGNKIGGITRIIIAEGGFTYPATTKGIPYEDFNTKDKAWLLIEQDWSYETWMRGNLTVQKEVIEKICKNHTIDVRLYKNNTGALMQKTPGAVGQLPSRPNGPDEMIIASELNTDWQLLSNDFIVRNFVDKWSLGQQPSFLLKGLPNTIFNPPADVDNLPNPPIPATQTLYVGGQQNPPGKLAIGIGETFTNKFWFVDLNVYNWPYGITTTKEIFKFNVDVCGDLDVSGNIDISGNLGVVGNSTFENITVNNQATIGTGGNITIGPTESTFVGIINNGNLDNSNNEIKTNTLFVAANGSNGNNMTTEVIPRILPVTFNPSHLQNTFEYYKLASINATNIPNQNWFSCNGFFELNYYYTGGNFNGAGKSATMQMIRFMVGGTSRLVSGTTYNTDNLYIKILSNQYQGPNTATDIKFQDLVLITNARNQLILYSKIYKPQTALATGRYSIRIYQDTNDVNFPHDPNTNWKLYDTTTSYIGTTIPTTPIIKNRYDIDLTLQAPDLNSPIDGMDMKYIDTLGNDLLNSNVINTQPTFFQQYTKFDKGIDTNNTKIINNRGLLGKNQSVIGNNVGTTPPIADDMYIESIGEASDIHIKVQPNQNIKFIGRNSTTGNESTNSIDINPLGSGVIDMNFNGTNNIKGVNNMEAVFYGDINANDINANDISANKIYVDNLESKSTNKIIIGDDIDLTLNDVSNVNVLNVHQIHQNSGSNQIILGNSVSPSDKYIRFYNKLGLYTATSLTNAVNELNGSNPQNYLIGYRDNDISGGLIYRADIASGTMNKLVTTTSTGYFSTNYFRMLDGNGITNRQKIITYTASNTEPFYRIGFNYTDSLILSGGVYAWYPSSPAYPPWSGTNNSSFILNLKNLQLPRDQLIRVLSFTFEGYNTSYELNVNGFALPNGQKTYFEIVFGFGNNRVFETGPWTSEGQKNFIKCFEIDTSNNMIDSANPSGNAISLVDLSLNTYYNHNTNPINNNHKPIENKVIQTYAENNSGFIYNDLQPYIFIRAMNGLTFTPWTRSTLLAQSGSSFDPAWTLENNTKSLFGNTVPSSDLPWTCPFGAQFQFENYIPAS